MSNPNDDLVSAVSAQAHAFPESELRPEDLPPGLATRLDEASVIGLGEASHGTQEFFDLRFRLVRLLVQSFGVRAIGFEAGFDPMCRVGELVAAGEGEIRPAVEELGYRPFRTEPMLAILEWLQSYNASRPPEDRVRIYGFDTTVVEYASNGLRSFLERVDADVDESLFADLDTMTAGYDGEDERQAMLESARRAHSRLAPLFRDHEAAWVDATSRRAYEAASHRLHLVDVQLDAHERDREGRMALRDEAMAENAEWIQARTDGPIIVWGANGHLGRGRHVLEEWDVDVPSMGEWLAESYGDGYCSIGLETATGAVAAKDFSAGEVVDYPIPDPPAGSIPAVLGQVDDPVFWLRVDAGQDDPAIREWLRSEPRRHNIWGGHPEGDNPVRYSDCSRGEFDWLLFVRETTPLVHLD
ncbi:erythromycin esterase family protein [Halolamina rubra]|uniref:erythromycin esterase family protein n=1 Tax=Halolamina rubra TaxID=1380430 RepID=UPI00067930ED|nr:erythromycin esterase family protein [Halolamina rubra]